MTCDELQNAMMAFTDAMTARSIAWQAQGGSRVAADVLRRLEEQRATEAAVAPAALAAKAALDDAPESVRIEWLGYKFNREVVAKLNRALARLA